MPWSPSEAKGHTKKANTPKKRRQWAAIANSMLESGKSEGAAIAAANAAMDSAPPTFRELVARLDDGSDEPEVTKLQMSDAVDLDDNAKVGFTREGFLKANPRIARTGIQRYLAYECGDDRPARFKDTDIVLVYRPEEEVFNKDTVHTYTHLSLTNDHPTDSVGPDNWSRVAVGETGDEVLRDGNAVRVPMMLRDGRTIADYKAGKRQLSVGYTCDLEWKDGETPQGEPFNAIQRNIRANHLAVVTSARGGSALTIGDDIDPDDDENEEELNDMAEVQVQKYTIDNIPCMMTDIAYGVHTRLIKAKDDALDAAKKKNAEMEEENEECKDKAKKDAEVAAETIKAKDVEIATLKQQLKDAQEASSPAALDRALKDRETVITAAAALVEKGKLKLDNATAADVRRQVVNIRMGDTAKDWDDKEVSVCFRTLADAVKTSGSPIRDAATAFGTPFAAPMMNDRAECEKAWSERNAYLESAYQKKTA